MDPRYIQETSKHLEKQHELLWDTYRSMTHELQKLQVEEEMLMRKFYEAMSAQGLNKKPSSKKDIRYVYTRRPRSVKVPAIVVPSEASMSDNLSASPPTPTTSSSDLPATRRSSRKRN
ncbi:uncharacterized protein LOC108216850 [Daucus carota subsp. sativus]|uniref:Uncharacterized protein n=1 Tax=Daucus carota subsp. sativus TaxID=79200 RepID=A0A165Z0U3_DAUCS|nr:PREDICTED: uncharacterized protein LOC108216850 [Daucus carota subsp. sativus]XP_017245196.1 PREDICTED: uncharacterized protein LOC108216850 [Daucus carota subsp. sativus]